MKIFEFYWKNISDVKEWMFAHDKEDAKQAYLRITGCGDLQGCHITEVPKEKWSEMYLLDIDDMEPEEGEEDDDYNWQDYENGYKIIESFADYAERNTITDLIATTEF
ncbi:MAG: hypothetical protein AAGH46_12400 [Bacteroidota bacterium]